MLVRDKQAVCTDPIYASLILIHPNSGREDMSSISIPQRLSVGVRSNSYTSSTSNQSQSNNHSLATQSLRNLNISSSSNSNSNVECSPTLVAASSPPSPSDTILITTTPPPTSTSKYGSISRSSQFDSLQTLLEQAGYKETRILTPTGKLASNSLQIQQQSNRNIGSVAERGKGEEKVGDAIKSLESIPTSNGNEKKGGGRGWMSRFNSWTSSGSTSNSNNNNEEDKENIQSSSDSDSQGDVTIKVLEDVKSTSVMDSTSALGQSNIGAQDLETSEATSSSSSDLETRKNPSKSHRRTKSKSKTAPNQPPRLSKSTSNSSLRSPRRPNTIHSITKPISPAKRSSSPSSSKKSKVKSKKQATRNTLWLASVAHHQNQQHTSPAQEQGENIMVKEGIKTLPGRMKVEGKTQDLKKFFEGQASSTTQATRKENRPIPHTVSAIKGSGSGLRTVGARAVLRGGVGLGLGIGTAVEVDSEKVEPDQSFDAFNGEDGFKTRSKSRSSLLDAFDDVEIEEQDQKVEEVIMEGQEMEYQVASTSTSPTAAAERGEWKKSLGQGQASLRRKRNGKSKSQVEGEVDTTTANSRKEEEATNSTSRTTSGSSFSPTPRQMSFKLVSTPAEPVLSHRAAVALRNADCLNMKPSFSLGLGRGFGSLRGWKGGDEMGEETNLDEDREMAAESGIQVDSSSPHLESESGITVHGKQAVVRRMGSIETLRKALNQTNISSKNTPELLPSFEERERIRFSPATNWNWNLVTSIGSSSSIPNSTTTSNRSTPQLDADGSMPSISPSTSNSNSIPSPPTLTITSPRGVTSPKVLNLASSEFQPKSFSPDTLLRKEMIVRNGTPRRRKMAGSRIPLAIATTSTSQQNSVGDENPSKIGKVDGIRKSRGRYSNARELAQKNGNEGSNSQVATRRKGVSSIGSSSTYAQLDSRIVGESSKTEGKGSNSSGSSSHIGGSIKPIQVGTLSGSAQVHKLRRDVNERRTNKPLDLGNGETSDPFKEEESKSMKVKEWKSRTLPLKFSNPTKNLQDLFSTGNGDGSSPTSSPTAKKSLRLKNPTKRTSIYTMQNVPDLACSCSSQISLVRSDRASSRRASISSSNISPDLGPTNLPASISGMSELSDYVGEVSPARLDRQIKRMSLLASKMNALAARNDQTPDQSMEDLMDYDQEGEVESPVRLRSQKVKEGKGKETRK